MMRSAAMHPTIESMISAEIIYFSVSVGFVPTMGALYEYTFILPI